MGSTCGLISTQWRIPEPGSRSGSAWRGRRSVPGTPSARSSDTSAIQIPPPHRSPTSCLFQFPLSHNLLWQRSRMAKENPTTKKVLRIGHRGAAGHATENTLRSIEEAIALRCDLIEVDVRRTRDGALVLLHDERVDRTTNGKGAVAEMTLKDLRQLDADGEQRIPTLQEALHVANGRVGLILELKASGIGGQVCALVQETGFTGPVIYASF